MAAEPEDAFELLGERGPPLKDAIQKFLLLARDAGYTTSEVALALAHVSVNMAAKWDDPEVVAEFARMLDSFSTQLYDRSRSASDRS